MGARKAPRVSGRLFKFRGLSAPPASGGQSPLAGPTLGGEGEREKPLHGLPPLSGATAQACTVADPRPAQILIFPEGIPSRRGRAFRGVRRQTRGRDAACGPGLVRPGAQRAGGAVRV